MKRLSLLIALVGAALCASASADTLGYHPVLEETGGDFYIPFNAPNSGELGAPTRPDGGRVGLVQDTIIMHGGPRTATGYVTFTVEFDLTDELQDGELELDPNTAMLSVLATNAHFEALQTQAGLLEEFLGIESQIPELSLGNGYYPEELEGLDNSNGLGTGFSGNDIWMKDDNYTDYAPGGLNSGFGLQIYNFHLRDDLGWSEDDFMAVNEAMFFALDIKYGSRRTQYSGAYQYTNQATNLSFVLAPGQLVPEPASMSVLGLAALALLRRRR